jgi:hypothetical protein
MLYNDCQRVVSGAPLDSATLTFRLLTRTIVSWDKFQMRRSPKGQQWGTQNGSSALADQRQRPRGRRLSKWHCRDRSKRRAPQVSRIQLKFKPNKIQRLGVRLLRFFEPDNPRPCALSSRTLAELRRRRTRATPIPHAFVKLRWTPRKSSRDSKF